MTHHKTTLCMLLVGIVFITAIPIGISPVATNTPVQSTTPDGSGLMDILWTDDGDWYPDNDVARYRLNEAPEDETFYQWWYWSAKNLDTGYSYGICYYIFQAPENPELEGVYVLFSAVTPNGKVQIWYKYDLTALSFLGNDFAISINNGDFTQLPQTNDEYSIAGEMFEPTMVWTSCMTYPGLTENSHFAWDLDISRIVGCCTQNDYIDNALMEEGIKWDTFCFDGEVSGYIQMGDEFFIFDETVNSRSYADMNFDRVFLGKADEDEPEDKYCWSWASATKYASNPQDDTSIIAGYGISDNMFGIPITPVGSFAAAYNVLDENIVWKSIDTRENMIDVNLIEKCSWGSSADGKIEVDIDAWDYFTYTDAYGDAIIPHYQKYTLDCEYCTIEMTFYVDASVVNRLPSAYTDYMWSNFEALGATADVKIYQKTYKWWDVFHLSPEISLADAFVDTHAGLEYGYAADMDLTCFN